MSLFTLSSHGFPWCVSTQNKRQSSPVTPSSYKGTNPIMWVPSSWPHLNLINSQRPHLPSHWCKSSNIRTGQGNIQPITKCLCEKMGHSTKPHDRLHPEHWRYYALTINICSHWTYIPGEGAGNQPVADDAAASVFMDLPAKQIPRNHSVRHHSPEGTVQILSPPLLYHPFSPPLYSELVSHGKGSRQGQSAEKVFFFTCLACHSNQSTLTT